MSANKSFWVSWFATDMKFEIHSPWWVSGQRDEDEAPSICAAVRAVSEDAAKAKIISFHDNPTSDLEWRFVKEQPSGWTPFNDRFRRAAWMVWPDHGYDQ